MMRTQRKEPWRSEQKALPWVMQAKGEHVKGREVREVREERIEEREEEREVRREETDESEE